MKLVRPDRIGALAGRVAGRAFTLPFSALKVIRPRRPIHPEGVSLVGTIERFGANPKDSGSHPSGLGWIDTPGIADVQARLSRSIGLPHAGPDIIGLALRFSTTAGYSDVLLASTGFSRTGLFLLTMRRHASSAKFSSLMPYKGVDGPVLLAARTLAASNTLPATPEDFRKAVGRGTWTLGLYHARPLGPWIRFGTLSLQLDPAAPDTATRFDPVKNPLDQAGIYPWTARLRVPSYSTARR